MHIRSCCTVATAENLVQQPKLRAATQITAVSMKKWWRKTVTGDENASVRGYLFGGDDTAALGRSAFRAANSPTAPNSQCFDTVVKLRGTVNTLEKRQAVLQQRIDAAHALAMKKNKAKENDYRVNFRALSLSLGLSLYLSVSLGL